MPSSLRKKARRSIAAVVFGSSEDAPIYCASVVVVLSAITVTLINILKCLNGEYDGLEKQAALLAGALAYLFYARTKGRQPKRSESPNPDWVNSTSYKNVVDEDLDDTNRN